VRAADPARVARRRSAGCGSRSTQVGHKLAEVQGLLKPVGSAQRGEHRSLQFSRFPGRIEIHTEIYTSAAIRDNALSG
jgi:hypothetical protein